MIKRGRFIPPKSSNLEVAALGRAIAQYFDSLNNKNSLTLDSATGLDNTPVGAHTASTGAFTTLSATGLADLSGAAAGQIKFPATQNASANVNTLDDYKEGTWTPTLTFATPGDVAVTYSVRLASYVKVGRKVTVSFLIVTSAFTHTTSSGAALISGLPFVPSADTQYAGSLLWGGITKAGYTSFVCRAVNGNGASLDIPGSGSGVAFAQAVSADLPSGGAPVFVGTITYFV